MYYPRNTQELRSACQMARRQHRSRMCLARFVVFRNRVVMPAPFTSRHQPFQMSSDKYFTPVAQSTTSCHVTMLGTVCGRVQRAPQLSESYRSHRIMDILYVAEGLWVGSSQSSRALQVSDHKGQLPSIPNLIQMLLGRVSRIVRQPIHGAFQHLHVTPVLLLGPLLLFVPAKRSNTRCQA